MLNLREHGAPGGKRLESQKTEENVSGGHKEETTRRRLVPSTYGENEAVLEVGELLVALLAAEHAVVLVYHLLVAVLAGAGLVQTVLLTQVHHRGRAGEVVSLREEEGKPEVTGQDLTMWR